MREVADLDIDGGVVVGDDGSTCGAAAVREGALEAALRGEVLHVIRAWTITSAVRPSEVPRGIVPTVAEFETATREAEEQRVRELVASLPEDAGAGVLPLVHVVHGPATQALIRASQRASLLVVGTRGLGGFSHLLMGSVAEQCSRHAACSVLVVRV